MLLWPNPFAGPQHGYYGPKQEALIEFVGGVAGVINKSPAGFHPYVKIIAGGIALSCDVALRLDDMKEADYRHGTSGLSDLYTSIPGGVVYYY